MSNAGPSRRAASLDQLRKHGDAHAHVRREDDRDRAGVPRYLRLAVRVETGGARRPRATPARAQAARCASVPAGRVKSINTSQLRDDGVHVCGDANAGCTTACVRPHRAPIAGLPATSSAPASVRSSRSERRLDQRLAHAATGAGNGDAHRHARESSVATPLLAEHVEEPVPGALFARRIRSAAPSRSRMRLSSTTDSGISSPSQRATLARRNKR